ncbi:GIY-YIG nuclease family protein [Patescibacteria group bacterium]
MNKFKFLNKEKISSLPKTSGVYAFKNEGILYIGKAINIKERVKNHFNQPDLRNNFFINKVTKIGYIKTDSEIEALILEANLIKKQKPKYNVVWRDDKNYFFVGITKENFPQLFITHQIKEKAIKRKERVDYVGPFVDGKALKETLKALRKVFPFRSCRFLPKKSCLWYHINRCPAPCLLSSGIILEIPKNSIRLKKDSRKNAENIIKILEKGKTSAMNGLKKEMRFASKKQDFEKAAKLRNQVSFLERIMSHAKVFSHKKPIKENWLKTEMVLGKIVNIKKEINRIEAYDVSNIQGNSATGSMVTFIRGNPDKNLYRRFKMKIQGKTNDTAMIKEVLSRRFKHPEWGYPDLLLIDGGKAQLNAAKEIKNKIKKIKNIPLISLAKRKNELFVEGKKNSILLKTLPREIFNTILHLRDEAHRFAISYHKKLRKKDVFN